jgi:hypothetical protein
MSELPEAALDEDFRTRAARGDFRTLGRHAAGVQLAYPWSDELTLSAIGIHAPADGSGIAGPSLSWLVSDRVSLTGGAYVSYGARSPGVLPRSEYGSAPATVFVQLSVTDGIGR